MRMEFGYLKHYSMTKKDLLEAIEDMPMDTPIKAVIRLKENHSVVANNLVVSKERGMVILRNPTIC